MTHIKTWQERAQGSRDINVVVDAMEAEIVSLRDTLVELREKLDSAQKDAERYSWLRAVGPHQQNIIAHYGHEAMDEAVDRHMNKEGN